MDKKTAIYHYCNYQPRCHKEVRNKLYEIGATTPEVEELIAELIENKVLNEEMYARSFCRGKFRMKQWGRKKIIQQLKFNKISDYCIKRGLTEIDAEEYNKTMRKLISTKWESLKGEKVLVARKMKVLKYMMQKGYESDLVHDAINEIVMLKN